MSDAALAVGQKNEQDTKHTQPDVFVVNRTKHFVCRRNQLTGGGPDILAFPNVDSTSWSTPRERRGAWYRDALR